MSAGTMSTVGLATQVGGSLLGAYGKYSASQTNQAAYDAQAAVEENKAAVADMQARSMVSTGQQTAFRSGLNTGVLEGTQRAALAARGIDLGSGSALNVLLDTKYMGGLDQATITDNANKEAWALSNTATAERSNAAILRGRAGAENPMLAGATSLLSSAPAVASSWYKWKNSQPSSSIDYGSTFGF